MNPCDFICHEHARMGTYQLLSEFFQQPEEGMKAKVNELWQHLNVLGLNQLFDPGRVRSIFNREGGLKQLLIDYSQLFVGPYGLAAPPYGSIYLDNRKSVMGDSTLDVQSRYARFGIEMHKGFMDMPDHITAELEFMYFLVFKEIDAFHSGRHNQVYDLLCEQNSFLNGHLNRWVPEFSQLVAAHSETDLYPILALTAQGYVAWDLEYLTEINPEEMQKLQENEAF